MSAPAWLRPRTKKFPYLYLPVKKQKEHGHGTALSSGPHQSLPGRPLSSREVLVPRRQTGKNPCRPEILHYGCLWEIFLKKSIPGISFSGISVKKTAVRLRWWKILQAHSTTFLY